MSQNFIKTYFVTSFIIIFIIIFFHYIKILKPIEDIFSFLLSPLQSVSYSLGNNLNQKISGSKTLLEIQKENNKLKEQIKNLENQIITLKSFVEENNLIENQNEFIEKQNLKAVTTSIIGKNEKNPNILILNKGSNSGIKKGMVGIAQDGLLAGKIISVDQFKSLLLLVIDNSTALSAKKAGNSEIVGLISGKHNTSIELKNILKNTPLEINDLIVTSGFDEYIPENILIGQIESFNNDPSEIFKNANINSRINFKNLKIISIILE